MVAHLRTFFPRIPLESAEDIAHDVASIGAVMGVPVTRDIITQAVKKSTSKASGVVPAVEALLTDVPERNRRDDLAPAHRKFTVYGRLVSTPFPVFRNIDEPAERVYVQNAILQARERPEPNTVAKYSAAFRRLPVDLRRLYDFDLRREAYCQRRLITDLNMIKYAAAKPDQAAWCLFADSLGHRLPGRPALQPVPHFFTAYYEYYRETNPNHFESQDVVDEIVSVLTCKAFQQLAAVHYAMHANVRDDWQSSRTKVDLAFPKFETVAPSMYELVKRPPSLSKYVATVAENARSGSFGSSIVDNVIEATAEFRSSRFLALQARNRDRATSWAR
jgi:hypothetical protein